MAFMSRKGGRHVALRRRLNEMVVFLFFLHGLLEGLLSKDGVAGEMYQGFCTCKGIAPPVAAFWFLLLWLSRESTSR